MKIKKTLVLLVAIIMLATALAGCGVQKEAKAWPDGDVTFYIPAAAGGGTDICARLFSEPLSKLSDSNVIIVNDTTGGGTVAFETIRNAEPDGKNLLFFHTGMCSYIASGKYDHTLDEFKIIDTVTSADMTGCGLFVSADSPFVTLEDFITYAKAHPGELIGGVEIDAADHCAVKLLEQSLDIETTCVHAGSNAEKLPLLMGGSIDFMFCTSTGNTDYVKSGDLRALCVSGSQRHKDIPDVPTLVELGYEEVNVPVILFIAGPADLPDEICQEVHTYVKKIFDETSYPDDLLQVGFNWEYLTPEEAEAAVIKCQEDYDLAFSLIKEG